MTTDNLDLTQCLLDAKAFHGDLCAGITIGTRMAITGLNAIGIGDPKGKDKKDLIVFVEMDRCAADAILSVTGCHPGKRSMKILDYGKMAATFINLKSGKAVRVAAKNKDGDRVSTKEEIEANPHSVENMLAPTAEELFTIEEVAVNLKPEDMPGRPLQIVTCTACGERIMDKREISRDGKVFCKPCASGENYYKTQSVSGRI